MKIILELVVQQLMYLAIVKNTNGNFENLSDR